MALTVGERPVHPLTAAQVLRMAEAGILDEDAPVELLDGVLTRVSPRRPSTRRSRRAWSAGSRRPWRRGASTSASRGA